MSTSLQTWDHSLSADVRSSTARIAERVTSRDHADHHLAPTPQQGPTDDVGSALDLLAGQVGLGRGEALLVLNHVAREHRCSLGGAASLVLGEQPPER